MVQVKQVHTQVAPNIYDIPGPRRGAILLVEDRSDVRIGLAQLLQLHGFVVRDTDNGEQAFEQLASAPGAFALLLLDLVLPGRMDGRELRARQLADADAALVPTVVVSACEPDEHLRAQLQPAAWLEKPFRIEALLAVVKQHVLPEWEPDQE